MNAKKWVVTLTALMMPILGMPAQTPESAPPSPESVAAPSVSPAPSVSAGAADVVKMAESGTSEDVLVAYVKNSNARYDLNADQILYLRDVGITSPVITAMLNHDADLKTQPQSEPAQVPAPTPLQASAPAPTPVQAPPPGPNPMPASSTAVEAPLTPPASLEPAAAPAPPVYVSSPPVEVSYFYDSLSPYGTWVQLDGVGWCWQPRVVVVNHAWQPYCNSGHWVYTDAGWFWQSDYTWGWAAFHYGRWHLHDRCGWVWMPDRVWGPAWVTWRYEGDHCGWAPLPPHADFDVHLGWRYNGVHVAANFDFGLRPATFTFISLHDFNNHDYAHYRLPPTQVTKIYNHTTVINNYVVNNNTVINQGIKVDRVKEATHTEVKKVAIRETAAPTPGSAPAHATGRNEIAVYRPELKATAKPVNMVAQKVDDRHPVIQHTPVPTKSQRPLVAESATSGNRGSQDRTPRPNSDRMSAPNSTQAQSNPRGSRPNGSASPAASAPTSTHAATANAAQPSNGPAKRPETDHSQPSRPAATGQNSSGQQYYPLRSGSGEVYRPAPTQSTQTYYPKGHNQPGDTRPSPSTSNGRPSDSHADSHAQATGNSRQGGSNDSNRNSGGPSKKNDL